MFVNIFPKNLLGLIRLLNPRHRFQAVMLPIMALGEYQQICSNIPAKLHSLNKQELSEATSFKLEKRQKEWLTGRVCAKTAFIQYHNKFAQNDRLFTPREILIGNAASGRPLLQVQNAQTPLEVDLSISHGADFGVALVAETQCGIDIQRSQDTLLRVREKFCWPEEEEVLCKNFGDLSELMHLTLLWTAKEAAKKALSSERMPGFLELILTQAEAHTNGWQLSFLISSRYFDNYPLTIDVGIELYDGYAIAFCILPK
ncbi:4'-phosphopantetheinyl transferase family protein [Desulfosediminicola ganghwensis]|uniref:4'-phosphopantetheinyl transferase family protein n=1 Tax=Desulfosediminicola ganghwensis TaxID=2569540 RepID=UPI00142EA40A|nr:4'-phosphopantetheinyl transferase superfamily protein [Desulfosediminicola ganghwensis]